MVLMREQIREDIRYLRNLAVKEHENEITTKIVLWEDGDYQVEVRHHWYGDSRGNEPDCECEGAEFDEDGKIICDYEWEETWERTSGGDLRNVIRRRRYDDDSYSIMRQQSI